MSDSTRALLFGLCIVVWLVSLAFRLVPRLRDGYPHARRWLAAGLLAILGLLAVSFLP
jgi:hypothetical protein